jgi:hypothetical protein
VLAIYMCSWIFTIHKTSPAHDFGACTNASCYLLFYVPLKNISLKEGNAIISGEEL